VIDEEKTRVLPRNFEIAAKTIVMKFPPRMTVPGEPPPLRIPDVPHAFDPCETRLAKLPPCLPPMAAEPPVEITTKKLIRRPHLVRQPRPARQILAISPSVVGPAVPPAPPPLPIASANRIRARNSNSKRILLAAGAALLVALVLILPLSSLSANSQTPAVTQYQLHFEAIDDRGDAISGVAVAIGETRIGTTGTSGVLRAEVNASKGERFPLHVSCPKDYDNAKAPEHIAFRDTEELAAEQNSRIHVLVECARRWR